MMNLPKPANDDREHHAIWDGGRWWYRAKPWTAFGFPRDPTDLEKRELFLRSESWTNPEAVEDRVFEQQRERRRRGLRLGDPDPLDPRELLPPPTP